MRGDKSTAEDKNSRGKITKIGEHIETKKKCGTKTLSFLTAQLVAKIAKRHQNEANDQGAR